MYVSVLDVVCYGKKCITDHRKSAYPCNEVDHQRGLNDNNRSSLNSCLPSTICHKTMSSSLPLNTDTPLHSPPVVTAATADDWVSIIGDAEKHDYASNCDVKVLVVLSYGIF